MNEKLLFASLFVSVISVNQAVAQSTTMSSAPARTAEMTKERPSTALKPEDGTPYKFATQEELDNSVPRKIEAIKARMTSGELTDEKNRLTDEQLRVFREELWRLENAVVVNQ